MGKKVLEDLFYDETSYEKWLDKTIKQGPLGDELSYNRFKSNVVKESFFGMTYYNIYKDNIPNNTTVFYFHGGAYLSPPSVAHLRFIDNLVNDLGINVVLPLYPRIPFFDAKYAYQILKDFYFYIINTLPQKCNVVFMGDSAGGGIVLSLGMLLKNETIKQPNALIMFSPWLDVATDNDMIKDIEPYDDFLSTFVLQKLGTLWRGDLAPDSFLVNSLLGDLDALGKISIFTGTKDILYPDAYRLSEKLTALNISHNYTKRDGLMHVYNLLTQEGYKLEYPNILSLLNKEI